MAFEKTQWVLSHCIKCCEKLIGNDHVCGTFLVKLPQKKSSKGSSYEVPSILWELAELAMLLDLGSSHLSDSIHTVDHNVRIILCY